MRITPPSQERQDNRRDRRGEVANGGGGRDLRSGGARRRGRGRGRAASSASAVVALLGPADGPRPCFAELERRLIDVDASIRDAYGIMGRGRGR